MKLISWNVNGLESCIKKGFKKFFKEQKADFFAFKKLNVMKKYLIQKGMNVSIISLK